jgi:hypothetical protein
MEKGSKKVPPKFFCKRCLYASNRKSQWIRHLSTTKHKMDNMDNPLDNSKSSTPLYKCACGKQYKYNTGLSKHKKKCLQVMEDLYNCERLNLPTTSSKSGHLTVEMFNKVVQQNNTLMEKLVEMSKDRQVINYQNCNNKKMTINVFLNEQCKNAMNLTDFVENVKVSLDDLQYTRVHGYVKGISNIFAKNLQDLDPTERPIHCSDKKRLQFYIKEENKWEKDMNNEKIDKTIESVTVKQIKQLKEWEKDHPNYMTNDKLLNEWHTMIQQIMGGSNSEIDKNKEQIKKSLGNQIEIKDAMVIKV